MKFALVPIFMAVALSSCTGEPTPQLPADAETVTFTHTGEAFLRGLTINHVKQRDSVIIRPTYQVSCLSDGAQTRLKNATAILDKKFIVAPITFNNPREMRAWPAIGTKAVISTGCAVKDVDFDIKTSDPVETMVWALRNGVPPV